MATAQAQTYMTGTNELPTAVENPCRASNTDAETANSIQANSIKPMAGFKTQFIGNTNVRKSADME